MAGLYLFLALQCRLSALAADAPPLSESLNRLLDDPRLKRAAVSVRVLDLAGRKVLYDRDGDRLMIPASNVKLFTTAAALVRLSRNFEFRTFVGRAGSDLVVVGGGDPTIGARSKGDPYPQEFRDWAGVLKARGIRRIDGDLVVDDAWFDDQYVHPNWPRPQLHLWYCAPVAALVLGENCVQVLAQPGSKVGDPAQLSLVPRSDRLELRGSVRTVSSRSAHLWSLYRSPGSTTILAGGSFWLRAMPASAEVTVDDPPLYFGSALKASLQAEGIDVRGTVRRRPGAGRERSFQPLLTHCTPLLPVLEVTNKESQNLYAEQLFKTLGAVEGSGSWPGGRKTIEQILHKNVGLPLGDFVLDDGSGLSKQNRLSAAQLTRLLQWLFDRPEGELFRATLAVAGSDGTLERRFTAPALQGRIFAKTGSLSAVRALSGYVQTADGRWLAFSFLVNDCPRAVKDLQDRFCRILVGADGPEK